MKRSDWFASILVQVPEEPGGPQQTRVPARDAELEGGANGIDGTASCPHKAES